MNPLVSVVIPNYKRVAELERALKSVLAQTYPDMEILIVDDASPNIKEVEQMLSGTTDPRIKLIKQPVNQGGGAARNAGILQAKGKYIAFLDSDDTWEPAKIEEQVREAEKYDTDVLCYTQSKVFTDNWKKIKPDRKLLPDESIGEYLFVNYKFLQTSSILVNTSLAKKCLFDETLPRHQDYDFLFKVEKHQPDFVFIKKPLVNVLWQQREKVTDKKWKPELSADFFNHWKKHLGKKAYANAFFNSVVYVSAQFESRRKSLIYARQLKSDILLVNKKVLAKYLVRLIIK